ncbi:hypothetical protein CORC01_00429 [Colletotrichum orchidophilum]|uniref:Uncharacterized protein n=1 Tax=Colletotrichum orchidophilum TaxID=1209926 RepID=A0A1G4BRU0_9PEZI|nr:uncharacterized protein CORC01_00429 [Colletotrichum orchidophilum]OHF04090.1 hypothetical protein CORC01_00429 [Colletotrichum orchidophilum]
MSLPCLSSSLSMPCSHPIHFEVPHCPSPSLHPIPSNPRPIQPTSHPITHHPSPVVHHPSPIPLVRFCGPQSTGHRPQSTALGRHRRWGRRGATRKKSQDPGGYIKKEPLCPAGCVFHLKSSVPPLLLLYSCALPSLPLEIDEVRV